MTDQPPVLRRACQHCGCQKHAVQYLGERLIPQPDGSSDHQYDKPGVCLVCPRCDSPAVVAET